MRINPVPFLFAPGAAVAGYLVAEWRGALIGTIIWTALVALATFIAFLARKR
jgi:hypothetical protein